MTSLRLLLIESLNRTLNVLPVFETGLSEIVRDLLNEVNSIPERVERPVVYVPPKKKNKKPVGLEKLLPPAPKARPLFKKLRKEPEPDEESEDTDEEVREVSDEPPDPVLEQAREADGARALLLEIIRRAAYDWVLYRGSSRLDQKQLAEDAYVWLFVEDEKHPHWALRAKEGKSLTALLAICHELDLEVETVRKHVRSLTPNKVMSSGRPPESSRSSDYSKRVEVHADIPGGEDDVFDFESLLNIGFDLD